MDATRLSSLLEFLETRAAPAQGIAGLEALDGFICGVAVSPVRPAPSEWIMVIRGEYAFESREEASDLVAALMDYFNFVVSRITAPPDVNQEALRLNVLGLSERLDGVALPDGVEPQQIGAPWAMGFMRAYALTPEAWNAEANDWEVAAGVLGSALALRPAGYHQSFEAAALRRLTDAERVDILADLPVDLRALFAHNLQRKLARQTVRRTGPKPGRNDPCPCGSGRKYKQCHGIN